MKPTRNSVSPGDLVRIYQRMPVISSQFPQEVQTPIEKHVGEGLLLDSYVNQPANGAGAYFNFYEVLWNENIRQLNGLDYSLVRISDV